MTLMCNQPPIPSRYPLIATLALTLALVTPAEAYTYMIEISWVKTYWHDKAADINPNTSSDPTWLTVYDGALYFAANDGEHGRELWKYDGSTASLVADINPGGHSHPWDLTVYDGRQGSVPAYLTVYDGALYFAANDGEHGRELWKYDGTTASLVTDVQPGSGWSSPHLLIVYDGALYFRADVGSGSDLWRYDGNTASFAADLSNFCCLYWGRPQAVYDGALYFGDYPTGKCADLCRFDGVTASPAADLAPLQGGKLVGWLTVYDGDLYFGADHDLYGTELWKYDGNSASFVGDINPGPKQSHPSWLTEYHGELYFQGREEAHGTELYRYSGSTASLVADINSGPASSAPNWLTVFDNALYFNANDGADGNIQNYGELWRHQSSGPFLQIYAEAALLYEKWWEWPIDPTWEVDRSAGTLGLLALAEGAPPRLLARRSLDLNRPEPGLVYESSLLDPLGLPSVMAFVTVVFHDASGRVAASEIEVAALPARPSRFEHMSRSPSGDSPLEGEPDTDVRRRLEREARALLEGLELEKLRAMDVRQFPAANVEEEETKEPVERRRWPFLPVVIVLAVLFLTWLVLRTRARRSGASRS